ncbi:unnamed protein product [Paramecium sonneborni]|uniref:Uncharacterized protein n=1 Tax=Paramecium sonneborni TaxID=65129 RepID=A0A8S1QBM2_9CILI|nr:unnamed protein product [Paramecium sonneborni]
MSTHSQLTFKLMLIGSSGVGKTSIIQQYIDSKFFQDPYLTVTIEYFKKIVKINDQNVSLEIWDTSGHEKFQPLISPYYRKANCYIIVIESRDTKPIKTLDYWVQQIKTDDPENFPIFVILNDFKENDKIIKSYLVEQWCKYNRIKQFFQVSAKDNLIIKETFLEITKILLKQKQNIKNKDKQIIDQSLYFSKIISSENTVIKQQLKCNMQEKIDSIQCYKQHDSPPSIVLLDNNLKGVQRLICSQCINDLKGRFNGININEAIQTIQERKNNILNIISDSSQRILSILNNYLGEIIKNKTQILQTMDQMISQVTIWMDEIQQLEFKQCSYNFFDEIDQLNQSIDEIRNKQIDKFKRVFQTINQSYEKKIQFTKNQLQESLLNAQNTLMLDRIFSRVFFNRLNLQLKSDYAEKKPYNQIQYKLVQEYKQNEWCHALAFNNNKSIMVSSLNNNIKIWNFQQGQLIDTNIILDGHEKLIKCIVFSKKYNWFFSGSEDNTIRSWKEKQGWFSSIKWESSKANKTHSNWVIQLILNSQEDELISCSIDKTIKIWRISYDQNQIRLFDSLEKHQQQVLSISLNESEQQLISQGEDQQVILWEKNQKLKWQFKNIILLSIQEINRGARFLMDNQIICKTSQGQLEGYKLIQDQYQRQQVFNFEAQNLDEKPQQEFQIIFNIPTQLIVIKHHKYFYFFRNNLEDCKFQQVFQPLECHYEVCCFNITNDGKYFVVWICQPLLRFRIFELTYLNMQ